MLDYTCKNKLYLMSFIPLSLLLTSIVTADTPAKSRSYVILEGENLLVICDTRNIEDIDVYWTKNDTKSTFVQQEKRLEILNIKRNHSGEYICYASNTSFPGPEFHGIDIEKIIQVVNVDVQYPAEIKTFSAIPYELEENGTFDIICDFQANPNPVWSIFNRDNGYILMSATVPGNKMVTSPKVSCDYSGYWECTGSNMLNYGVNVTRGHNITVYCSPKPRSGMNRYTVIGKVGEPIQLSMYIQANPRAVYTWSKDDGMDISNATVQNDDLDGTNLTFSMLSVHHFGNYTLKMENMFGTNYAHFQILPDATPDTPAKSRSYVILEGENLLVICNTTKSQVIDVYWTKNDTKSTFVQQGKRLEILNIKRNHSGEYICHASNTGTSFPVPEYHETDMDKIIQVVDVDVQYPAEIKTFSAIPYELEENSTFDIICDFQANPKPVWSIFNRDNGYILMSATVPGYKMVTSPKVSCDYSGYWECTGSNMLNYGVNVTRGHNITVYCSPKPRSGLNRYTVIGKVGEPVQLTMYIQANPRAVYTWSKDDGMDISNTTVQNDDLDGTNLTFSMLSVPHYGNYTLKMENMFGTNFAHYQILADGKPETPTNLQFSDVTQNSVKLQWTSGFDMGSRQHFIVMKLSGKHYIQVSDKIYDNSTNHGTNQNWTYVLDKLVSDTNYNLTIIATNERGFRSALAEPSVAFRTKQDPNKKSKTDVKLILGLTFGTIGMLGMLAFIVYVVKFRSSGTSSDPMKEAIYLNKTSADSQS